MTRSASHLSPEELDRFQKLLLAKRLDLVGDITAMEEEALRSSSGNLVRIAEHRADVGSESFERDLVIELAENDRERLREIEAALERLEAGAYGVCERTGEPIPRDRLEAQPWARCTVEAEREG